VAVAAALALVIILFAVMCSGPDVSAPSTHPTSTSSPRVPGLPSSSNSPGTDASGGTGSPGPNGSAVPGSSNGSGTGGSGTGGGDDGADNGGPAKGGVVASVPCADADVSLTAAVSPSPGIYGGVITLTLIVRNTADQPCLRDVGSAPQELQVRQGATVVWSSDHCNTPQTSDVRAFGPNIESRFSLRWNTYRVAPHECDPPADAMPAGVGTYQVVARLGTKLSDPVTFEIQK
jgi:hypothetical protein